jgi:hypothetical protein
MNFPLENAGGSLGVTGDTLRLTGGSVTAFTGVAGAETNPVKLVGGTFTLSGGFDVGGTSGALVVTAGTLALGANTLTTSGDLTFIGTGLLNSSNAAAVAEVGGDATFAGGTSVVTAGRLVLRGGFTQGPAGSTSAFAASGTHLTSFDGNTGRQVVSFANPGTGAAASRFAQVDLGVEPSPRQIELQSDVFATDLQDTLLVQNDSLISATNTLLTTATASLTSTVFAGARLSLTSPTFTNTLDLLRFDAMDPTSSFFSIDRNAGVPQTMNNATFITTPSTGFYVTIRGMTAGPAAQLLLPAPVTPTSPAGLYQRLVTGGATLPIIVWAGVTQP